MDESEPRSAVFVVRMWREGGSTSQWRGSVDRVGSGARAYFANIGTLCEFMLAERELQLPGDLRGQRDDEAERP